MANNLIIYCAGGIVWRDSDETDGGREVLLILSRDDQSWKFPKGHIDPTDPSWDAAAQREVKEETGYDTMIIEFAGHLTYPVRGYPKVIFYWHMQPLGPQIFEPSDEIEHCQWFPLREAVDRLTFLNDKKFLLQFATKDESRHE